MRVKHLFIVGFLFMSTTGAGGTAPPYDPILVSPADGVTVYGVSPSLTFKWQPVQGATSYRLCLSEPGPQPSQTQHACGTSGTQVYEMITSPSFAPPSGLPERFRGKTVGWQVAACNDLGCTYQPAPRRFTWSAVPQAPILDLPIDGVTIPVFPRLFVVKPGAGVVFYKLCFSPPGVACGAENSVVIDTIEPGSSSGNMFYDVKVDQVRRFAGQTINWTAAACNALGCTWQQATRRITIP